MAQDVYQVVTDRIVEALKTGVVPWRKEWTAGQVPMSLKSKKPYRGVNVLILGMTPYKSPYWVTFKQAVEMGGKVKKGEKGSLIVFWKMNRAEREKDGKQEVYTIPLLRFYYVFNTEQCEGLEKHIPPPVDGKTHEPIAACEKLVEGMPQRPPIKHGGDSAYYAPVLDYVQMPNPEQFSKPAAYYGTLFHELVHATGHSSRLDRGLDAKLAAFGTPDYSEEELTAEMGAAMLLGVAGAEVDYDNSAAYIQGWLSKLASNPRLLVQAAARAQKAADFIQGVRFDQPAAAADEE